MHARWLYGLFETYRVVPLIRPVSVALQGLLAILYIIDRVMYLRRVLRRRFCLIPCSIEANRGSEAEISNRRLSIRDAQEEVLIILSRVCANVCSVLRLSSGRSSFRSC